VLLHIRTSEENKAVVSELTRRMFPQGQSENIISRIALAYSISKGERLNLRDIQNSQGKEYKEETLLGSYKTYYVALICQHYGIHKENADLPRYLKMHVDDGLQRLKTLFADQRSYTGLDFLMEHIERGSEALEEVTVAAVVNLNQNFTKGHFAGPLPLLLGHTLADAPAPIRMVLNDTRARANAHLAVAGSSGTGKTQFALDVLRQVVEGSNNQVNFLYLDFKGLKNDDVRAMHPFFERTRTTFINAPERPFPLNPLAFIDNVNEKGRLMGISKFADIIATYAPRMGATQTQQLKDATKAAFARKKAGAYPSLADVSECLFEVTGGKADTLTEIMRSLSDYELFAAPAGTGPSFLNQNYYFSLSGDLDRSIRFTASFLAINYVYTTFMGMENAPVSADGIQALRYVLLIDEAHVLFKDRKAQELLESMLREIRSKGVAVMLLSQGIEEFNQPTFDFSSECANAVLLELKDRQNLKPMAKFLGYNDAETRLLGQSMSKIQKGQAVTNAKEFKKGELFAVEQYWK